MCSVGPLTLGWWSGTYIRPMANHQTSETQTLLPDELAPLFGWDPLEFVTSNNTMVHYPCSWRSAPYTEERVIGRIRRTFRHLVSFRAFQLRPYRQRSTFLRVSVILKGGGGANGNDPPPYPTLVLRSELVEDEAACFVGGVRPGTEAPPLDP